jgi:hypothetical protein
MLDELTTKTLRPLLLGIDVRVYRFKKVLDELTTETLCPLLLLLLGIDIDIDIDIEKYWTN